MAHPFEKIFEKALKKSASDQNEVTIEAVKILKKGYAQKEIVEVLTKLRKALIDEKDEAIIQETIDEIEENG